MDARRGKRGARRGRGQGVRVGLSAAEATLYVSDTSVVCTPAAGAGGALAVTVTIGTDCGCVRVCAVTCVCLYIQIYI